MRIAIFFKFFVKFKLIVFERKVVTTGTTNDESEFLLQIELPITEARKKFTGTSKDQNKWINLCIWRRCSYQSESSCITI